MGFLYVILIGLIIGSFLNVVIQRLPKGESIVLPASRCPVCGGGIKFYDNIPIISYLILRGKCRICQTKISIKYPVVEFINGIGYFAIFHEFGFNYISAGYAVLFSALVAVAFIDLDLMIVPDEITLPGIILGIAGNIFILPAGFTDSILGIAVGGGLFYLIAVLSNGGMGGGDIKLIAMIGSFLGWRDVLLVIFISAAAGSAIGIFLMIFKGKDRKFAIPYGPFISLGAFITMLKGPEIIIWYLQLGS